MKCEHCGSEAPERAVICPECGEILPREEKKKAAKQASLPTSFQTTYLNAGIPAEEAEAEEDVSSAVRTDPALLERQKKIRKTRLVRRIVGLAALGIVVLAVVLYTVFLGGYKRALYCYVKGADHANGGLYVSTVPDAFIDHLDSTYDNATKREVKEMVGDYFVFWNQNYGNEGRISYEITHTEKITEEQALGELESTLRSSYDISLEIEKAVQVKIKLNDGGVSGAESLTFIKVGMRWYSMEAMEDIEYICQNDGYGVW